MEHFLEIAEKYLTIYIQPIRECYECTDHTKIASLKLAISRRVERTLPTVRKYIDNFLQEKHGVHIADNEYDKTQLAGMDKNEFAEHCRNISKLIVGHDEIEDVYVYGPLKDWAKEFYSQFSKQDAADV